jgi:integrase
VYTELLSSGRADRAGGLDPKSVLEVHVIVRKALADATRKGLVVRNVADGAEAPKRRRPKRVVRAWTAPQLQPFLTAARPQRLFPALWLAATTGMRRSELLGLRWEDLDTASGRLSVHRALVSVAYESRRQRCGLPFTHGPEASRPSEAGTVAAPSTGMLAPLYEGR